MDLRGIRTSVGFTGTLEEGIERVKRMTEEFRIEHYLEAEEEVVKKKEEELGEEGKVILDILRHSSFDEYTEGLVKVLSKICVKRSDGTLFSEPSLYESWKKTRGSTASSTHQNIIIPIGTMVVLLANHNSHDYQLQAPILVVQTNGDTYGKMAVNMNGRVGNFIPSEKRDLRPATPEEIDTFFRSFPKE